jgi:drug/metabolite transporter (DMT)-like permease
MEKPLKLEISARNDEIEKLNAEESDSHIKPEPVKKRKSKFKSIYGILLAFGCAISHSIMSVIIKKAHLLSGGEQTAIRYLIQTILMAMVVIYKKIDVFKYRDQACLLVSRALLGVVGLITAYFAIIFVNPSDSSSIINSSIVITALLSRVLLKEKLSIVHVVAIITTVVGVVFISQPSFIFPNRPELNSTVYLNQTHMGLNPKMYTTIGLLMASVTAFALSCVTIILKKLSTRKVHYSLNMLLTSILGLPVSLTLSAVLVLTSQSKLVYNIQHKPNELLVHVSYAVLTSFVGVLAQILFNLSLKYEDASKVSIIKCSEIFFAFLLQYLLLNIRSDVFKISGGCLIFVSGAVILTYKIFEKKHSKRKQKRKDLLLASQDGSSENVKQFNCCTRLLFSKF